MLSSKNEFVFSQVTNSLFFIWISRVSNHTSSNKFFTRKSHPQLSILRFILYLQLIFSYVRIKFHDESSQKPLLKKKRKRKRKRPNRRSRNFHNPTERSLPSPLPYWYTKLVMIIRNDTIIGIDVNVMTFEADLFPFDARR